MLVCSEDCGELGYDALRSTWYRFANMLDQRDSAICSHAI